MNQISQWAHALTASRGIQTLDLMIKMEIERWSSFETGGVWEK